MQFRKLALAAAVIGGTTAVVAGCSSSNSPVPFENTVTAKAAMGALAGATCVLDTLPASGGFLPSAVTDSEGVANFSPAILNVGPFVMTCSGGSYYNEATGGIVNLGSDAIRVAIPSRDFGTPVRVGVTSATDLIVSAIDLNTAPTPALLQGALTEVARALGFPNLNLLTFPETVNTASPTISGTDAAGLYAVLLAGLAQLADELDLTPHALGAALRGDVEGGQPLGTSLVGTGTPMVASAADFLVRLDAAVNTIVAQVAAPGVLANLQAQVAQQQAASQSPERGLITPANPEPTPTPTATPTPTPTATPPPTGGTGGTGGSGGGGGAP